MSAANVIGGPMDGDTHAAPKNENDGFIFAKSNYTNCNHWYVFDFDDNVWRFSYTETGDRPTNEKETD